MGTVDKHRYREQAKDADRPEPKGTGSGCCVARREHMGAETPGEETEPALTLCMLSGTW